MADEPAPADGQANAPDDPGTPASEVTLTDLIDQIERAAFERTLELRHGPSRPGGAEPANA